jgi:hypothetical protein
MTDSSNKSDTSNRHFPIVRPDLAGSAGRKKPRPITLLCTT